MSDKRKECNECDRPGYCSFCNGYGYRNRVECPNCLGRGACPSCDGTGYLQMESQNER